MLGLAGGGMAAFVLFRAGIAPGGQVGADVLLACAGWWFGLTMVATGSVRAPWGEALHRVWPAVLAALAAVILWLVSTPQNGQDRVVRGAALAVFGGYGNWHLISVGPTEAGPTHLVSPLQSLWPFAVAVQGALVFTVLFAVVTRVAKVRRGRPHPVVLPALVVSALVLVWGVVVVFGSSSPDRLVADSRIRGVTFLVAAAIGAAGTSPLGRLIRALSGNVTLLAGAVLVIMALFAKPGSAAWTDGGTLASVLFAVALVVAAAPWPPRPVGDVVGDVVGDEPAGLAGVDLWGVLVAVFFLHGPVLALLAPVRTHLPWLLARLVGLAFLAAISVGVSVLTARMSRSPEAAERRRVLVPPVFVVTMVAIFSLTGAFHWEGPRPLTPKESKTRSSEGNEPG